jgi:predicted nucleic acid-binding protein
VPETVFLDTSALIALNSVRDLFHAQAISVRDQLDRDGAVLVTTDLVLSEFLAGFARPPLRARAIGVVEGLRASERTDVVACTRMDWDEAFKMYKARENKAWSLADCASILLCTRLAIKRVFTTDEHFGQAGLVPILRI